jgi:hypothetical protein
VAKNETPVRRPRAGGRLITAWGDEKPLAQWLRDGRCRAGSAQVVEMRLFRGWPAEKALATPPRGPRMIRAWGRNRSLTVWLRDRRCRAGSWSTVNRRLALGWEPEEALATPPGGTQAGGR